MSAARRLVLPLAVLVAALVAVHPVPGGIGGSGVEPAVGRAGATPLLDVSNLAPGRAVRHSVTVANVGAGTGTFVFQASASGSRRLAVRLKLVVESGGRVLYAGPLAGLESAPVGVLDPGEERRLVVRVALPRSAGNELQGLLAGVDLRITARG